jgi:hypothetical protein
MMEVRCGVSVSVSVSHVPRAAGVGSVGWSLLADLANEVEPGLAGALLSECPSCPPPTRLTTALDWQTARNTDHGTDPAGLRNQIAGYSALLSWTFFPWK